MPSFLGWWLSLPNLALPSLPSGSPMQTASLFLDHPPSVLRERNFTCSPIGWNRPISPKDFSHSRPSPCRSWLSRSRRQTKNRNQHGFGSSTQIASATQRQPTEHNRTLTPAVNPQGGWRWSRTFQARCAADRLRPLAHIPCGRAFSALDRKRQF